MYACMAVISLIQDLKQQAWYADENVVTLCVPLSTYDCSSYSNGMTFTLALYYRLNF